MQSLKWQSSDAPCRRVSRHLYVLWHVILGTLSRADLLLWNVFLARLTGNHCNVDHVFFLRPFSDLKVRAKHEPDCVKKSPIRKGICK